MKKTIAIVEDDSDTLEIMSYIIGELGYRVAPAATVAEFRNVLKLRPDLILLDERLGDGHGHILCSELKATRATRHIPVVLVSVHMQLGQVANNCGADDYLSKPFDINDLADKIEFWLNHSLHLVVQSS